MSAMNKRKKQFLRLFSLEHLRMMSQEVQESFRDIVQGCLRSDKNSCDALRQIPKRWEVGPTINFYTNFMSRMALTLNFDKFEEEDLHEISRNIFNTYILLAKRIKETIDPDQRALKELQMALGRAEKECKNAQSPFTLTLFNSLLVVFFDLRINKQFQVYMEGAPLPFTSSNSLSIDRARFHFLLGRFQLLNRMFPEARASFWKSLTEGYLNTARVYFYLTPLEIMNGNIPAIGQLEAVGIHDYRDLVVSIRDGNLALFEKQLHENMLKFTKYGVWEVVGLCKVAVHAQIVRQIQHATDNSTIEMDLIAKVEGTQIPIVPHDVFCSMAGLSQKGFLKCKVSTRPPSLQILE